MFFSKKLLFDTDSATVDYFELDRQGDLTIVTSNPLRPGSSIRRGSIITSGSILVSYPDIFPISANADSVFIIKSEKLFELNTINGTFAGGDSISNTGMLFYCDAKSTASSSVILTRLANSDKTVTNNMVSISRTTGVPTVTQLGSSANVSDKPAAMSTTVIKDGVVSNVFNRQETESGRFVKKWYRGANSVVSMSTGGTFCVNLSDTEILYSVGDGAFRKATYTGSGVTDAAYITLQDAVGKGNDLVMYENGFLTVSAAGSSGGFFARYNASNGSTIWKTDTLLDDNGVTFAPFLLGRYKDFYYGILCPATAASTSKAYLVQIRPSDGAIMMKEPLVVPENRTAYSCFYMKQSVGSDYNNIGSKYIPTVSGNGYFVVGMQDSSPSYYFTRIKIKQGASHNRKPTL